MLRLNIITLLLLLLPSAGFAAIVFDANGSWRTTFDCDDWVHPNSGTCDDLSLTGGGGNTTEKTRITVAANNPTGAGGKGIRFWVADGSNQQSAPIYIRFPEPQQEVWFRWYERWESGAQWQGGAPSYTKAFYVRTQTGGVSFYLGYAFGSGYTIYNQGGGGPPNPQTTDNIWQLLHGGPVSDGSWHAFEVQLKMDTGSNDGIGRLWINGELIAEETGVSWSGGNSIAIEGFDHLMFKSNQATPTNDREVYIDYDDIVVYNQTPPNADAQGNPFIGPIGWGGGNGGGLIPTGKTPFSPSSRAPFSSTSFAPYAP